MRVLNGGEIITHADARTSASANAATVVASRVMEFTDQVEIRLGIIPGYAGTQRLARLVGKGRAMELVLRGHQISAQEALQIGLVNRVVPAASLMDEARALANELAAAAPVALRYAIDAINRGSDMPFADACVFEATLFGLVASTDDMREGTRAFAAYGTREINERHRHRYEFNPEYRDQLSRAGLVLSGASPDGRLVEMIELADHPWFVGSQFHPEFQSGPFDPHPLFSAFVAAAIEHAGKR